MAKKIEVLNSNYIEVDGIIYERMESETVNVELDFDSDVMDQLNDMVKNGPWVSKQELIRHILREAMEKNITIADAILVDKSENGVNVESNKLKNGN